jgi:hypothetical protein
MGARMLLVRSCGPDPFTNEGLAAAEVLPQVDPADPETKPFIEHLFYLVARDSLALHAFLEKHDPARADVLFELLPEELRRPKAASEKPPGP